MNVVRVGGEGGRRLHARRDVERKGRGGFAVSRDVGRFDVR